MCVHAEHFSHAAGQLFWWLDHDQDLDEANGDRSLVTLVSTVCPGVCPEHRLK